MIETENIISLSEYVPRADTCDEPDLVGRAAARRCTEDLIEELAGRGFTKPAIIRGIRKALDEAEQDD